MAQIGETRRLLPQDRGARGRTVCNLLPADNIILVYMIIHKIGYFNQGTWSMMAVKKFKTFALRRGTNICYGEYLLNNMTLLARFD